MPKLGMEWQRFAHFSAAELYEVLRFRQDIFVVEQRSPYSDLDGLDRQAWHLRLRSQGALAGYLRLVPMAAPQHLQIGRVAVAAALRRRGVGRTQMAQALAWCRARYPGQPIVLHAQLPLVPFYGSFGFVPTGEPFDDFGVVHVDMAMTDTAATGCGLRSERMRTAD